MRKREVLNILKDDSIRLELDELRQEAEERVRQKGKQDIDKNGKIMIPF